MTCSSTSTNKAPFALAAGMVLGLLTLTASGCGKKAALWTGPIKKGVVDISRLAPQNPAWSNVVFYDKMLASLPPVTTGAEWQGSKQAVLPAVSALEVTRTDLALAQERMRLDLVKRREVTELKQRLAEARQYELRVQGFEWRREQRLKTNAEIQRINAEYTKRVADQTQQADAKLLTLQLQVDALEKLTQVWDKSQPPSPELIAARADLVTKRQQLKDAQAQQKSLFTALEADYRTQLAAARTQGADAVEEIHRQRDAELRAKDAEEVARAEKRLQTGMDNVLDEVSAAENRSWIESSVPPAKSVGYRWPQPPVGELLSARLTERARLAGERQRWVDYVYGETRRAADDVAATKHWQITYLPSGKKSPDMTAQVAAALASSRWRPGGAG